MKLRHPFFIALLLWSIGCNNTPPPVATSPQAPESVACISLVCQNLGADASDIPHSVLLLGENGGATILDTVSVNLVPIEKEKYAEMGIPTDAADACGGWYAGGGDYFYVIQRNGVAEVYRGYLEEQQSDTGYHWTKMEGK